MMNEYVAEKLRELEEERLTRALIGRRELIDNDERPHAKPVIGPVVRAAGRTLRRAGEGLEGWAARGSTEADQRSWAERRTG